MEAICQGGCDFLRHGANLHAMYVTIFAQAVIDEIDDAGGNGEAQALAAAAVERMKVLMPTTEPFISTSGPPLLPGLMGASV